jgi:hypothetical protein
LEVLLDAQLLMDARSGKCIVDACAVIQVVMVSGPARVESVWGFDDGNILLQHGWVLVSLSYF